MVAREDVAAQSLRSNSIQSSQSSCRQLPGKTSPAKMFDGTYEKVSSENHEEFLTAIKATDAWKKVSVGAKSTIEVVRLDDIYSNASYLKDWLVAYNFHYPNYQNYWKLIGD